MSENPTRYFFAQAAMDKYYVVDKDDEVILATCDTESNAEKIVSALNFNERPGDYGFTEQTIREHDERP